MSALLEGIEAAVKKQVGTIKDDVDAALKIVVKQDDLEKEVDRGVVRWMETNIAEFVERAVLQMLATSVADVPSLQDRRRKALGDKPKRKYTRKDASPKRRFRDPEHNHRGACKKKCRADWEAQHGAWKP